MAGDIKVGTYTGTGSTQNVEVGFVPDFLKEGALAEAQGTAPSGDAQVPVPGSAPQPVAPVRRKVSRTSGDQLGIVWLRGETLTFGSDKQRQLLGLLFDAYWSGSPVCRTAVVLFEAGYGDSTNAFSKVFSGRDDWRSFIKYADGNCWIQP